MADVIEDLAATVRRALGVRALDVIPSAAPGGGPEAERENKRVALGGRIGSHIPHGRDARGYGGHGDAVEVDADPQSDVSHALLERVRAAQRKGVHDPKPSGRLRFNKPFSIEGHTDNNWQLFNGPFSLFDGTIAAPSAGNSVVQVPVALPVSAVSPVLLLDRYPGAMFMCLYIRSFSFMPTGGTMTGVQECWFTDAGGAVVGLGIYNPANVAANAYQSIGAMCTSPLTDPGVTQLGQITVNNIGVGGTPVSTRWQMTVGFVAMAPDPWFNEQMIIPPTPAELATAIRTMGAQGG